MSRFISPLSVFFVFVIFASSCFAQKDTIIIHPDTTSIQPETKSGSLAFLFGISGLAPFGMNAFPLRTFDSSGTSNALLKGNSIIYAGGGKWYISDNFALRLLVGFSSSSKGNENSADGKTTTILWGLSGGVEMHTQQIGALSPYFGGQISLGGAGIANNMTISGEEMQTSKISGSNFGIGIFWGFDWFFTRGLAIGGEVMYGYSESTTTTTINGASTDGPAPSAIALSVGNVHLTVHF